MSAAFGPPGFSGFAGGAALPLAAPPLAAPPDGAAAALAGAGSPPPPPAAAAFSSCFCFHVYTRPCTQGRDDCKTMASARFWSQQLMGAGTLS